MAAGNRAKSDAITDVVVKIVARHRDAPARTLAKRVVDETGGALTLEQARSRVRHALGLQGSSKAKPQRTAHLRRPPRAAGQQAPLPPSRSDPWGPFALDIVGRVGILSDIHIPYHDEAALRAAVKHLQSEKIDALVLNGDFADFYTISRHEKDPKHRNFKGELAAIRQFLAWIRKQFPRIRIVAKAGNHEERWNRWLFQHAPEISDDPIMGLDNWLGMSRHGIEFVDDRRVILCGELPVLHGHEKGNGISSPVNQARGAFLRLHHTVLEGHGHRTSTHSEPDMFGRETVCFSTGCLCDLRPAYARFNKWNHGYALVTVHAGGEFDVNNCRVQNGKVRLS